MLQDLACLVSFIAKKKKLGLCDYSPPSSCSRIAFCMVSYATLRPTLVLLVVMRTSSAGAPTVALQLLGLGDGPCDVGLIGSWRGVVGWLEACCRPAVTSTVALFSHLASSSSVRATPSPPTSGRLSGTFAELLELLRLNWNISPRFSRGCSPPDVDPCDEALLRLRNLPNLPRGSGDKSGLSCAGSPGKLGGSIVSRDVVVVRTNWNEGTLGESVAPVGDVGVVASSRILSFFFNKSLSVILVRNGAWALSSALPA